LAAAVLPPALGYFLLDQIQAHTGLTTPSPVQMSVMSFGVFGLLFATYTTLYVRFLKHKVRQYVSEELEMANQAL